MTYWLDENGNPVALGIGEKPGEGWTEIKEAEYVKVYDEQQERLTAAGQAVSDGARLDRIENVLGLPPIG